MATIPRSAVDELTRYVNAISADAQARVLRVLDGIAWTPENVARCRELVVEALRLVLPEYATLAAQASADFYDATRELCVGERMGAQALSGYRQDAVDGAVRALVEDIVSGKPIEQFNRGVTDRVDYELKRAANVCVAENAARDPLGPRYARVPTGAETCGFCLMLASRGFAYTKSGAASHVHAGCDCRVVCDWGSDAVEGYDPAALQEIYEEARSRLSGRPTVFAICGEIENVVYERRGRDVSIIPEDKLTRYALDMSSRCGHDKAVAFELALGFTRDDSDEVMRQVYRWMGKNSPTKSRDSEWGEIYTADIRMTGSNGRSANVRTGWILRPGEGKMRMTTIYVH